MDTTLHNLITHKAFEAQQATLMAQFTASHIDYVYKYNEGAVPFVTVWLNHGNIPATIIINEDGWLHLSYFHNGMPRKVDFEGFSTDDFYAFINDVAYYLVNGNFSTHSKWFSQINNK